MKADGAKVGDKLTDSFPVALIHGWELLLATHSFLMLSPPLLLALTILRLTATIWVVPQR